MAASQSHRSSVPFGTYLPERAWRTTETEIVLLARVEDDHFTCAFTPDDVKDEDRPVKNMVRKPGIETPVLCFWPRPQLRTLLRLLRRHGVRPLPAQEFRIVSDGVRVCVVGKSRFGKERES